MRHEQLLAIESDNAAREIARDVLEIETLDERKSDRLDFHEVSVWQLRAALNAAYAAGRESVERTANA